MTPPTSALNNPPSLRFFLDPVLREICDPVERFDGRIQDLVLGLATTMHSYGGIGLAAPQAGVSLRLFIADTGHGLLAVANPSIREREGSEWMEEGCLSLPEMQVNIERSTRLLLHGRTPKGEEQTVECEGLLARVVQHEIDHLDGVLIIDHAPFVERVALRQRMKRLDRLRKTGGLSPHPKAATDAMHHPLNQL